MWRLPPGGCRSRSPLPSHVRLLRKSHSPSSWRLPASLVSRYEKGLQDNLALRAMRPDFLKLVRLRFEAAYPAGLLLRNRRNARLALEYHPACMGLRVDLAASSRHLTDPIKLDWSKFVEFAGRAAADLAPLGRLLAFHPERRHSLAALASCPPELAGQLGEPARNWLNALSVPVADVAFKELAQHAIAKHPSKWTLREHREVCEALASAGWCMIPDAADGPERLEDDTVVQLIADPPLRSPRFGIAAATALLVAAIARTVGDQGAEVEERWLDKAGERLALQAGDVLRLRARLHWLRRSATNPAKAGRLMKDAGPEDREFAAWSATIATLAAGPPDKPRLIALEAIYDKLEVPRRALYATMHGAVAAETQGAAQPVIIAEGGPWYCTSSHLHPPPTGRICAWIGCAASGPRLRRSRHCSRISLRKRRRRRRSRTRARRKMSSPGLTANMRRSLAALLNGLLGRVRSSKPPPGPLVLCPTVPLR